MWGVFAQFKKNADAELADGAGCSGASGASAIELQATRRNWRPGNKGPADLTDMVEHVASLRCALGPRFAGMGVLDHVLGDVVAQTVDFILIAMFEHTGEVRHACLEAIEGIATRRFKVRTCGRAPI